MLKKERKAAVNTRYGALCNGAMRFMAELDEIAREFGDSRDLDGVANICPTHRAPDEHAVIFETPESILIAKEDGQEEVYEESETEETARFDVGMCVRVDGLLLCDHLMLEAREEREQEMTDTTRRMVVNALEEFEQDDWTKIGMRASSKRGYKYEEYRHGNQPFKERRRLARSRRNQQTRERIFRASERKCEEMWLVLDDEYYMTLAREWDEAEEEYYEGEYEHDLEWEDEEARQESLLAFALEGKDERELDFYDRLYQEWDEAAYERLEAAYEKHDRQEDLLNDLQDMEAMQAEEEERAEREELEILEHRWRGYFTNGAKSGDVPEDRVMVYNQSAIIRSIKEFERYGTTKAGMRISSRRWFKKNGDDFCTGNRPFKERPCGIARSRRLMAAKQVIEAIFDKSNEDEIANA